VTSCAAPWHAWELDIRTGRSWLDPQRTRVKAEPVEVRHAETFRVSVEDD
jgi:nitrite reductase/ring-hydroxylating ferredoxin subunit